MMDDEGKIFHLVAADTGICISQAIFEVQKDRSGHRFVNVTALMGATHIREVMQVEVARTFWRQLVGSGWTIPIKTEALTVRALEGIMEGGITE